MNCNTTHYRANSSSVPGDPTWLPGGVPAIESDEALGATVSPLSVVLPHGAVGVSPGEPVWDLTGGRFGPFAGQVFIGDYSRLISRVFLEKVSGDYQGAAFTFFRHPALGQGNTRMAFGPDGALYLGQATWGAGEGFQRITWDGRPAIEIRAIKLLPQGFALDFTSPMDARALKKPESYRIKRFRYLYHAQYGSPRVDEETVRIDSLSPAPDGRSVALALNDLQPGYVYEFQMETLAAESGALLENPSAFYTVNRLHDGSRFRGPFTKPIHDEATAIAARSDDTGAGAKIYATYCVACHQADGRGGGSGPLKAAANFVEDTTRLAKSDAELLRSIRLGLETTGMPPFGSVLGEQEIRDVLAYIREAFDPLSYRTRKK